MDEQNDDRCKDMDELKTRLMKENAFLKSLATKPMSVYFDAYRTKAYDGGGEENLTFQVGGVFFIYIYSKLNCYNTPNVLGMIVFLHLVCRFR